MRLVGPLLGPVINWLHLDKPRTSSHPTNFYLSHLLPSYNWQGRVGLGPNLCPIWTYHMSPSLAPVRIFRPGAEFNAELVK